MTTQTFTIPSVELKAMLQFAAKNDVRYYLNGLHFVPTNGGIAIQATDGHVLGILHVEQPEPMYFRPFTIERGDIERLKLSSKGVVEFEVTEQDTAKHPVKILHTGATLLAQPIDGKYPDVVRVVPATSNGEPAFFNPELLTRFVKASKLLGLGSKIPISLHYNGQQCARVSMAGRPRFVGCVMPMRVAVPEPGELPTPAWFGTMPRP